MPKRTKVDTAGTYFRKGHWLLVFLMLSACTGTRHTTGVHQDTGVVDSGYTMGPASQAVQSNIAVSPNRDKPSNLSLDDMLQENSGLIHYGGRLWTVNDSDGEPVLFALDIQTGKVIQAVRIRNGVNRDWESLAQDQDHIYVCDVGNNYGRREVLTIYKLAKDSIPASGNASFDAEIINYSYAGRPKNSPLKRSPYDCEAAFAAGDSLYLLTKDWEKGSTTLYACSTLPGKYAIRPRREYSVDGLVTGADFSREDSLLVLCGYKDYVPIIWLIEDFNPADYSHGRMTRFEYPELVDLQTEGISLWSPGKVLISCEMTEYPAGLYEFDTSPFI